MHQNVQKVKNFNLKSYLIDYLRFSAAHSYSAPAARLSSA